jgi:hypothetical protein
MSLRSSHDWQLLLLPSLRILRAAASNSLKTATATVAAVVVLTPADFVGSGELAFARPVTFTTAGGTPAHAPATAALEGLDVDGKFISETVNVGQTATTVSSTKCYKKLLKVTYAAADGTDATVAIGHGAGLGLARAPKSRAGLIRPLFENQDGAAVSPASGTLSAAATNPPYGMYTPADPADGTSDYAVFYEADQSVTNA